MGQIFDFITNSADGVFAVDHEQRIVLWNHGATAILGYRSDDVIGRNCCRIIRGVNEAGRGVCHPHCEVMRMAERLDLPPTRDMQVRDKNNDRIWVNISTVTVPAANHALTVVVHMFRDVTQQHELLRVVRDFAGIVSGIARRSAPLGVARPYLAGSNGAVELTRRERQTLGCLTTGLSTNEIAERLGISRRTVRNHISNMLGKLGVHSRLEAVTYSINNGLF